MPHVGLGVKLRALAIGSVSLKRLSPIYVAWGGGIVRRMSKLGGTVRDVTELVAA
jgi:hypothetical protein